MFAKPERDEFARRLRYLPEDGMFFWISSNQNKAAGYISRIGYVQIGFGGRLYYAHRLAWLFAHGEWPNGEIDHINGDKTDNRLSNLRLVNRSQNSQNLQKATARNSLGVKGVCFDKTKGRYVAHIRVNKRLFSLGAFKTIEEAAQAYKQGAQTFHTHNPSAVAP